MPQTALEGLLAGANPYVSAKMDGTALTVHFKQFTSDQGNQVIVVDHRAKVPSPLRSAIETTNQQLAALAGDTAMKSVRLQITADRNNGPHPPSKDVLFTGLLADFKA